MPRIRTVKPTFWQDEDLAQVSEAACLLAIGLLNHADDEGYFKANPKLVESVVFPLREVSQNVHELLMELSNISYVSLFEGTDKKQYGRVNKFTEHQRVSRPTASKIKDLIDFNDNSMSSHAHVVDSSSPERKGKERKGRESSHSRSNLIDDFEPSDQTLDYLQKNKIQSPTIANIVAFKAHHNRQTFSDDEAVQARFIKWMANEHSFNSKTDESIKPWHETSPGIITKGAEFNLYEKDYPNFPAFKHAVFEKAGYQPDAA